MLVKHVLLAALCVPSIMASIWPRLRKPITEMAVDPYPSEEERNKTGKIDPSIALGEMATNKGDIPYVVKCIESLYDPYPKEESNVSGFVDSTMFRIDSNTTGDAEAFANVITAFKLSSAKPLASIRMWTLSRNDAGKVLKKVMEKAPKLVTESLPEWLASHGFSRASDSYRLHPSVNEQAFQYLLTFATEQSLIKAISIAKSKKHYKVNSEVRCCNSEDDDISDLIKKLEDLLKSFASKRKALVHDILTYWPTMLIELMVDYLDASDDGNVGGVLEATSMMVEKEQEEFGLSFENEGYMFEALRGLKMIEDPFPIEESGMSELEDPTVSIISVATCTNTEAFVKAAVSLEPRAIKRHRYTRRQIIWRDDVEGVLKRVMAMYPGLITGSRLPRWLTPHGFDRSYIGYTLYKSVRKSAFEHLVSQATALTLIEVLRTQCCNSEACYPNDLIRKLMTLIIQRKEELLREILTLPGKSTSSIGGHLGDELPTETPSAITE